jgi:phage-related baseplate assembly protein
MSLRDFKNGTQITGVIDLSKLPPPVFIKRRSFEEIFQALKDSFLKSMVERGTKDFKWIDSDPAYVMAEEAAYEIVRVIEEGNYTATQCLAAFAEGSNLDQLLLLLGVQRQDLSEIDPATGRPKKESDGSFLRRALLSQDRFSTAGAVSAYQYHVYRYCTEVLKIELVDVRPSSPAPGEVLVPILLAKEKMDGLKKDPDASKSFVKSISDYLNRDDIKPLTDTITVKLAEVKEMALGEVILRTPRGVSPETLRKLAVESLEQYRDKRYAIDEPITVSGIHSALTVSSDVIEVRLKTIKKTIQPDDDQAFYLTFSDSDVAVTDQELEPERDNIAEDEPS